MPSKDNKLTIVKQPKSAEKKEKHNELNYQE